MLVARISPVQIFFWLKNNQKKGKKLKRNGKKKKGKRLKLNASNALSSEQWPCSHSLCWFIHLEQVWC